MEFLDSEIEETTVSASAEVAGQPVDVRRWPYVAIRMTCDTAADGTLYFEFSSDGTTWPVSIPPSTVRRQ